MLIGVCPKMGLQPSLQNAMLRAIPRCHAFTMKLCRNPNQADDLLQTTIAHCCRGIAQFGPVTNIVAWLTTILRNYLLWEYRRASHRVADQVDYYTENLALPSNQMAPIEAEDLRVALLQLPPDERSALVLILGAGYSYNQVAEAWGYLASTIKSRVNRAKKKISVLLSGGSDFGTSDKQCDNHLTQPAWLAAPSPSDARLKARSTCIDGRGDSATRTGDSDIPRPDAQLPRSGSCIVTVDARGQRVSSHVGHPTAEQFHVRGASATVVGRDPIASVARASTTGASAWQSFGTGERSLTRKVSPLTLRGWPIPAAAPSIRSWSSGFPVIAKLWRELLKELVRAYWSELHDRRGNPE